MRARDKVNQFRKITHAKNFFLFCATEVRLFVCLKIERVDFGFCNHFKLLKSLHWEKLV